MIEKQIHNELDTPKILKSVFEGISDPLLILDEHMHVKLFNNAARNHYKVSPRTAYENMCCFELFRQSRTPCHGCRIPKAITDKEYLCFERKNIHDPLKTEQVIIYPVADTPSGENYSIVRIKNITKLRNSEKEIVHADKMATLGTLVSNVAHETNNPNNFIMMNIQLLLDAWKSGLPILDRYYQENGDFNMGGLPYSEMRTEIPELIKGIKKSSVRIKNIIKELKNFTRNVDTPMDDTVDINQVIDNAIAMTQKLISDATHCFNNKSDKNIPPIKGNAQQLEQVIINLIGNACQSLSSKDKKIFLSSALSPDKTSIIIEVQDQGEGIAPHLLPHIMDPFFTTRGETGGTGLGLSISNRIIKEHGGTLLVDSPEGCGTTFKIMLPLKNNKSSWKILIADDDDGSRKTLRYMLTRTGRFTVQESRTGSETLLQIGQDKPDLILMDIHMPDRDGEEVCRIIKNRPELSSIKIIITTGFINSRKTEAIFNLGFDTVLEKPIDSKLLLSTIDAMLGHRP